MNKLTRDLAVKLSRMKARTLELVKMETRSEDEQAELAKLEGELQGVELELRAAMLAEPEPEVSESDTDSPEGRELRGLVNRANLGAIFTGVIEHRSINGAERELQEHYGLADNQVPLALLETRAVTPAPSDVGQNQAAILPAVFPQACAAFLGVDMPRVGVGEAVYPVLTTSATVGGPHTDSTSVSETTGAFSADVLSPARLQASFFYRRTDRARFAGMDAALRMNLSDALSDAVDKEVINGSNGLLNGTNLTANNATAADSFNSYRSRFVYDRIDGKYASVSGDVRMVVGAATYKSMSEKYRGNSSDVDALASLMQITGGVKVSAHVPAVASSKQNAIVRRGTRRDMVAPMWEGVTLIPDEVTKAKTGEIVITAVLLHAVKILRADGFAKVQAQHA